MPVFLLLLAVQVLLIVDVIRNGRNQLWIMALMFLPLASTAAYVIVEIMPRLKHNRHVREASAQIRDTIDPERALRGARDQLDVADTIANRVRVANALTDLGRHKEALPLYRAAIGNAPPDRALGEHYARSLFQLDQPTEALAVLDAMPGTNAQSDLDRVALLRARILEELKRDDEALPLYADVSTRMPGDEARCRHAALLLKLGRKGRALVVLEEVERRAKRFTRQQRAPDADMYDWADRMLSELRG